MKLENHCNDVQLTLHTDDVTSSISASSVREMSAFTQQNVSEEVINLMIPKSINCLNINLSKKEACVLAMSAEGNTSSEIAGALHVSVNTVNFHIRNCLDKLNARNKTHAVAIAILLNLLPL